MAEIKVRQLDDRVADALRERAKNRGVSLEEEEEVRSVLTASVDADRKAMIRETEAIRERNLKTNPVQHSDSVQTIREWRDASG